MELGGNDPYIVLKDATLSIAAEAIVTSRLVNNGQVCIAAKRIIIVEDVYDDLLSRIISLVHEYKMGSPLNKETTLGPLARDDLRAHVHQQVLKSVHLGAKLICGGTIPEGVGFFYPATILTDVKPGMPAFDEELFGPVISLCKTKNENTAIELANQSRFGLSAAIFTNDLEKGQAIAEYDLEVGSCFVNGMVGSDPRLPFGGVKHSGFGRELSQEGIREFVNIKTIVVA